MLDELEKTDAENKLIDAVQVGVEASFLVGDVKLDNPENGAAWGIDRTIRAGIIYRLAVPDEETSKKIHAKGVRLRGCKITGVLDLEAASLPNPLWLVDCFFEEQVNLNEARTRSLNFGGSHIPRLEADGIFAKDSLYFDAGFTVNDGISLLGADIQGDLDCDGGIFKNSAIITLCGDGIVLSGDLLLGDGFRSDGEARFAGANIVGSLKCSGGSFNNPNGDSLNMDGATINGDVHLSYGFESKGVVRFRGARIRGDFHLTKGNFERPDNHEDQFYSDQALNADGLKTTGDVFAEFFKALGEVRFVGADIGSDLRCTWGNLNNPEGISFSIYTASIKGTFRWHPARESNLGQVIFEHASADQLEVKPQSWPGSGLIKIDGFEYSSLIGNSLTRKNEWKRWLESVVEENFRPQPYEQLVSVLRKMGHATEARDLAIEKQEELRKTDLLSRKGRAWNFVMGLLIGHGYRPHKVLFYIIPLIAIGAGIFGFAHQDDFIHPSKERVYLEPCYRTSALVRNWEKCEEKGWSHVKEVHSQNFDMWLPRDYPKFNAFAYSIDLFFPIVDLHQESYWLPLENSSGNWPYRNLMWLYIALGWFLTTIGVIGLTGIVKTD